MKNIQKVLIVAVLFVTTLMSKAEDPHIWASIFYESFDGTADCGGNDGVFSSSGSNYSNNFKFDNETWTRTNYVRPGAQCIRIGVSNYSSTLTSPTITTDNTSSTNYMLKFRAGLWNATSNKATSIYVDNHQFSGLQKGQMDDFSYSETKTGASFAITFSNATKTTTQDKQDASNYAYYFLDDVALFQDMATASQQQKAAKIVLTGDFTDVSALKTNLVLNTSVLCIDATGATFPENTVLETGNPNCLIFAAASTNLCNTSNLVRGTSCQNLVLKDGSPFHADKNFTAVNVSYDRKFTIGAYSTLCVPFAIKASDLNNGATLYCVASYNDKQTLNFTLADEIKSNTPILIKALVEKPFLNLQNVNATINSSYDLSKDLIVNNGSTNPMNCFVGTYYLYNNIRTDAAGMQNIFGYSGGSFYKLPNSANTTLNPFRCFLSISSTWISVAAASKAMILVDGVETGIAGLKVAKSRTD